MIIKNNYNYIYNNTKNNNNDNYNNTNTNNIKETLGNNNNSHNTKHISYMQVFTNALCYNFVVSIIKIIYW